MEKSFLPQILLNETLFWLQNCIPVKSILFPSENIKAWYFILRSHNGSSLSTVSLFVTYYEIFKELNLKLKLNLTQGPSKTILKQIGEFIAKDKRKSVKTFKTVT